MIASVSISFEVGDDHVAVEAQVDCVERTGVEMEALHACSVAALTIYDMCKSADRGMAITDLALWEKTGGRSGTYRRASGIVTMWAALEPGCPPLAAAADVRRLRDGRHARCCPDRYKCRRIVILVRGVSDCSPVTR